MILAPANTMVESFNEISVSIFFGNLKKDGHVNTVRNGNILRNSMTLIQTSNIAMFVIVRATLSAIQNNLPFLHIM